MLVVCTKGSISPPIGRFTPCLRIKLRRQRQCSQLSLARPPQWPLPGAANIPTLVWCSECGVVSCGVVWCGLLWCGVVCCVVLW